MSQEGPGGRIAILVLIAVLWQTAGLPWDIWLIAGFFGIVINFLWRLL